ncbi:MAG TPA: hypothetical protein VGW38_03515, partial [Chloroflexota bacterium]|nr:hypothetical protein [Chloroflexota bacterium]
MDLPTRAKSRYYEVLPVLDHDLRSGQLTLRHQDIAEEIVPPYFDDMMMEAGMATEDNGGEGDRSGEAMMGTDFVRGRRRR